MASFRKHGKLWYFRYVGFIDGKNKQVERKGHFDKITTQGMARDAETEADNLRKSQKDPYHGHSTKSLEDHLADWHRDMIARGKTLKHADQYRDRASKLLALAKGASIDDIDIGRSRKALERIAKLLSSTLDGAVFADVTSETIQSSLALIHKRGKSSQTVNHFRAAVRAFFRWAYDRKRIREIPMRGVESFNVQEDQHIRRTDG